MNKTKCVAVVTGPARSGTTMVNRIVNSHPEVMSGFELGILLSRIPEHRSSVWKIHSEWMSHGGAQFGLPDGYLEDVDGLTIDEVYGYIAEHKGSKGESFIESLISDSRYFTDKTPEYFFHLHGVVRLVEGSGIPVIAIVKDFDSYLHSLLRRPESYGGNDVSLTLKALRDIPDSVYMVKHESYLRDPSGFAGVIQNIIFDHNPQLERCHLSLGGFQSKIRGKDYPYNNWSPTEMTDDVKERMERFEYIRSEYVECYEGIHCVAG